MKKLILVIICLTFFFGGYFLGHKNENSFSIKNEIFYLQKNVNLLDDYRSGSEPNLEKAVEMEIVESVYTIGLFLKQDENLFDLDDKDMLKVIFKITPVLDRPEDLKDIYNLSKEKSDALVMEINRVKAAVSL